MHGRVPIEMMDMTGRHGNFDFEAQNFEPRPAPTPNSAKRVRVMEPYTSNLRPRRDGVQALRPEPGPTDENDYDDFFDGGAADDGDYMDEGDGEGSMPNEEDELFVDQGRASDPGPTVNPDMMPKPETRYTLPNCAHKGRTTFARSLKQTLPNQIPPAGTFPINMGRKRLAPEHDPENRIIKTMRMKGKSWAEIVQHLNNRRAQTGQLPSFTEAAVYGRFVRNGPRIAVADGEHDFDPKEYMHFRPSEQRSRGPMAGLGRRASGAASATKPARKWTENEDIALVECFQDAIADFWQSVADRMPTRTGKEFTANDCAFRYEKI